MSENKQATETKAAVDAKPATGTGDKKAKTEGKSERHAVKRVKQAWSLQRCQKAARRFKTETEWKSGAPSSYKSATAHGWVADCLTAMKQKNKVADKKVA